MPAKQSGLHWHAASLASAAYTQIIRRITKFAQLTKVEQAGVPDDAVGTSPPLFGGDAEKMSRINAVVCR